MILAEGEYVDYVDAEKGEKGIPRKSIRMGHECVSNNEREKEDVGDEDE